MSKLTPKEIKTVTPQPYYKIAFGCGNRAFYQVKNDVYEVAESIGIEAQDGYLTESCDYEGDLEEIRIYNCERGLPLIKAMLEFYGADSNSIPADHDLVLSIF